MNGFEKRRAEKKENILQAACESFAEKGFTHTVIAEIAARARVSQVSIYNFFENKEKLFGLVIEKLLHDIHMKCQQILEEPLHFEQKLYRALTVKQQSVLFTSKHFFTSQTLSMDGIRLLLDQFNQQQFTPFLYRLVESGKEEGQIDRDLSNEAIFLYIHSFSEALLQAGTNHVVIQQDDMREQLQQLFFHGLFGKSNRK